MAPLLACAGAGELWIADRNFCTRTILQGWSQAQASFIVREHAKHPRLIHEGKSLACGRTETGEVHDQAICVDENQAPWRPSEVSAQEIARLYRKRWRIEGMFQRLESVLHSEIKSLGHPRAALLGFAVAVLAYNVLSVLKRSVEHAHRDAAPQLDVSTYHLAWQLKSGYEGMLIALPAQSWLSWSEADPDALTRRLLQLAGRVNPKQVATAKRGPPPVSD